MGETNIKICLKKTKKILKNIKKFIVIYKNQRKAKQFLNFMDLIVYAMIQSYTIKSITFMSSRQTGINKNLIMHD